MFWLGMTDLESYTLMCCRHCAVIELYTVRVPGVGDMKEGKGGSTWKFRQGFIKHLGPKLSLESCSKDTFICDLKTNTT